MDKYSSSKYQIERPDLMKELKHEDAALNKGMTEETPDRGTVGSPEYKCRMNASNPWKPKGRKS